MKNSLKILFVTSVLNIVSSTSLLAQKFTTHAVKQGETLYSVAAKYGVSTESILRYNKEIKEGDKLAVNTILVVPEANSDSSFQCLRGPGFDEYGDAGFR